MEEHMKLGFMASGWTYTSRSILAIPSLVSDCRTIWNSSRTESCYYWTNCIMYFKMEIIRKKRSAKNKLVVYIELSTYNIESERQYDNYTVFTLMNSRSLSHKYCFLSNPILQLANHLQSVYKMNNFVPVQMPCLISFQMPYKSEHLLGTWDVSIDKTTFWNT